MTATRYTRWYVTNAIYGSHSHDYYLANGWEPFAVQSKGEGATIWFRFSFEKPYDDEPSRQSQETDNG